MKEAGRFFVKWPASPTSPWNAAFLFPASIPLPGAPSNNTLGPRFQNDELTVEHVPGELSYRD